MPQDLLNLAKMLSDEKRLRVLNCLAMESACVCELADALDMPQTTLSNHLAKLRANGIVKTNRDGTWIYYSISVKFESHISNLLKSFDLPNSSQDLRRFSKRLNKRIEGKCKSGFKKQGE